MFLLVFYNILFHFSSFAHTAWICWTHKHIFPGSHHHHHHHHHTGQCCYEAAELHCLAAEHYEVIAQKDMKAGKLSACWAIVDFCVSVFVSRSLFRTLPVCCPSSLSAAFPLCVRLCKRERERKRKGQAAKERKEKESKQVQDLLNHFTDLSLIEVLAFYQETCLCATGQTDVCRSLDSLSRWTHRWPIEKHQDLSTKYSFNHELQSVCVWILVSIFNNFRKSKARQVTSIDSKW